MVTLSNADKVLKTVYLDVICDQMNNKTNPFYAAIKKGSEEVSGKQAVAVCRYGLNGGMGSATETGNLPASGGNNYVSLTADLKNIYGTIEITDKALRSSRDSAGALVNILNAEMEGLLEAAKFNFGRMLWQNGKGVLATIADLTNHSAKNNFPVNETRHLAEGMIVDILTSSGSVVKNGVRISKVDRSASKVHFDTSISETISENYVITLQQSYNAEIFGIPYLYDSSINTFYGNTRMVFSHILPLSKSADAALSTDLMQETLDLIEEKSGNDINMIFMSYAVRRKYLNYLQSTRSNIDYMNLDGGFKTLCYNGVPVVADKFCIDNDVHFINTNDFKLVQLSDWQWMEGENGRILTQLEKTPTYTGTLVKYANLICTRPAGQGRLTGLTA